VTSERQRLLRAVALAYAAALVAALATAAALAGHHPLLVAAAGDFAATVVVFAASVRHDNASLYDPYWSVAPLPIAAYWLGAMAPGAPTARAWVATGLLALWAVRLTANCLARWRSLADEDFRYVELRRRTGRAWWPASFFSVHLFPTAWVFLGLLPLFPVLARPSRPLGGLDVAAALVTAGAILIEGLADRQLRRFLAARRDRTEVLDAGLWALSRHPNYFGEVLFWWGLWLFGLAADPAWWWTVAGPLAITALFTFVSVPWMDRRMEAHHPGWRARRAGAPALVPLPARRGDPRPPLV
jgi:steroid 5-alpha reductase family enzyme